MKNDILRVLSIFLLVIAFSSQGQDSTLNIQSLAPYGENEDAASLSLSLNTSYMKNNLFSIYAQNVGVGYNTQLFQDNYNLFFHSEIGVSTLRLDGKDSENSLSVGGFGNVDIEFGKSSRGWHLIGVDFGYALGIPQSQHSQFDEHNILLNIDYGYAFLGKYFSWIPYARVETYIFIPRAYRKNIPFDGGMNAILGLKGIQTFKMWEWGFNIGAFSDLNLSGSSIGILADNTIIYDREGISNGAFGEFNMALITSHHFQMLAKINCSYMLSYYEINLKGTLLLSYQF